jgi:hypothetical protein
MHRFCWSGSVAMPPTEGQIGHHLVTVKG